MGWNEMGWDWKGFVLLMSFFKGDTRPANRNHLFFPHTVSLKINNKPKDGAEIGVGRGGWRKGVVW